jgi:Class III cytochrome C family
MRVRHVVLSAGAIVLLLAGSVALLNAQPQAERERLLSTQVEMDVTGNAQMPETIIYSTWYQGGTDVPFDHPVHAEDEADCIQCHHVEGCRGCHRDQEEEILIRNRRIAYHEACFRCHEQEPGGDDCSACHQPSNANNGGVDQSPALGWETQGELLASMESALGELDLLGETRHFDPDVAPPSERIFLTSYEGQTKVSFSHQGHAEDYGISCGTCHHVQKCSVCHLNFQKRLAVSEFEQVVHTKCIGCHEEVDAPEECDQCHLPIRFE